MNKKIVVGLIILGIMGVAGGRQMFTPLSLTWDARQYLHDDKNGGRWADPDFATKNGRTWTFDLWGAGYNRFADIAFACNGSCPCMTPLTTLFFGKAAFTLSETFYNNVATVPLNPWVSVAQIRPNIEYNEQGAYFGANWSKACTMFKRTFHVGIRGNMPVKIIRVERQYNGEDAHREIETKQDLVRYSQELVENGGNTVAVRVFAYRYDLVNQLVQNQNTLSRMITYGDEAGDHIIRIAGQNVCTHVGADQYPVTVKGGGAEGTPPATPFGQYMVPAEGNQALANDGANVGTNIREHFIDTTNYTPLATATTNQRLLWLVPTYSSVTPDLSVTAQAVMSSIEAALATADPDVVDYLMRKDISFASQKVMGAGDTLLQLYLQRNWHKKKVFTEAHFGAILPSGVKTSSTLKPFCLPLGNNGHYEVELGADLGWNACNWAALQAGFSYHWALKGRECVAAPFQGACVKNIGPSVPANISWNYLLVDGGLTLVDPTQHAFGFNATYEFYHKTCDKICLCATQAHDLEDDVQDLCANNLTWFTKVQAHKVKAEMYFNRPVGSIFGGFDYIFAGKNVPKEIGWHLGLMIEF